MKLATWHWHIEISSKCTLHCPRCARQEVPDTLVNTELDIEFFWRNFPEEFIIEHVDKITFCGDDGDPIYAHDLVEVVKYFKNTKPTIEIAIVTNGSYKSSDWWTGLALVLDPQDSVHFSIDGYNQTSNELYRVNSDWDSILSGITTLRRHSKCHIVWDAIAFSFNEGFLDVMRQQAKDMGMDRFQLTKSTKFGKVYPIYGVNDLLEPRQSNLISSSERFEREITDFTQRPTPSWSINQELYSASQVYNNVRPMCTIGNKGLYISAQGYFYPCCWVANRYSHNQDWEKLKQQFDLNQRNLQDVLTDEFWSGAFTDFNWRECQTKCSAGLVTEDYASQW